METDRLVFKTWAIDNLEIAMGLWGDPEVTQYIDGRGLLSRDQVETRLRSEIESLRKNGIQYWPIYEKGTGDFVGCCGLKPWVYSSRVGPEMGFHLMKNKWGKGYAFEAAQRVADFAFNTLKAERIMAGHHPQNENSKKILERLGFKFVEYVFFKPTGLNHLAYELLQNER
jgi:RimJ/RimL family protein N-acetyltransferase